MLMFALIVLFLYATYSTKVIINRNREIDRMTTRWASDWKELDRLRNDYEPFVQRPTR